MKTSTAVAIVATGAVVTAVAVYAWKSRSDGPNNGEGLPVRLMPQGSGTIEMVDSEGNVYTADEDGEIVTVEVPREEGESISLTFYAYPGAGSDFSHWTYSAGSSVFTAQQNPDTVAIHQDTLDVMATFV